MIHLQILAFVGNSVAIVAGRTAHNQTRNGVCRRRALAVIYFRDFLFSQL
jgi:hypothetical protein